MTENEVKKILYTMRLAAGLDDFEKPGGVPVPLTKEELADACKLAIKALGEVQQYREIGTVEECRAAVEKQKVNKKLGRLIDADSVKDFFFSETSGTEETIRDLAEKHNLTYLNDVNEDDVMSFAKDILKTVQNVIETEPTAYDPDKVEDQLNDKFRVVRTDEDLEWNRAMDETITIVKGGGVDAD